ncbi:MAG: hypothetical protein HC819_04590 [Cyclobacteriaceae bacterium]|nr:hypothetical protein [Cyclobacteriaceae bacterium]
MEENWSTGKLLSTGPYITAYGDTLSSGNLQGGEGILKKYHHNQQLQEELTYKNGLKNGLAKLYTDKGDLAAEGQYVNDKKEGLWKFYHSNGNVESQGNYKDDEPEGLWIFFNRSGTAIDKKDYTKLKKLEESLD